MNIKIWRCLIISAICLLSPKCIFAQQTAFTYQGALTANNVAITGNYDLSFGLFGDSNGLILLSSVTNLDIAIKNGLVTTTVDFGPAVFSGSNLWLQIGVRSNGLSSAFAQLAPLQPITPAPYAITAQNADYASISGTALNSSNLLGSISGATQIVGIVSTNNLPAPLAAIAQNNGANLTNLSAANLPAGIVYTNGNGQNIYQPLAFNCALGSTAIKVTSPPGANPYTFLSVNTGQEGEVDFNVYPTHSAEAEAGMISYGRAIVAWGYNGYGHSAL